MTKKKIKHNKKAFYRPSEEEIREATQEFERIIDYTCEKVPNQDGFMLTKIIIANLKPDKRKELTKKLGISDDNVVIAGWIFNHLDNGNK